ncbi:MAG: thermonuclease family protein [Proteobacteria bacterium]|nr:thermonuclease family protein [Pseudomonadota bacterium]
MRDSCRLAILHLTLVATVTFSSSALAETLYGEVVGLADGDTVTVLDARKVQHRIRLAGIDAPEKKQAFGERSRQSLSDLVFGKRVTVEYAKTDRYGRIVGKVLADGRDVGLVQVQRGLAWHYKAYERDQSLPDRVTYARAQDAARDAHVGLWRDRHPTAPWDYRKCERPKGACSTAEATTGSAHATSAQQR